MEIIVTMFQTEGFKVEVYEYFVDYLILFKQQAFPCFIDLSSVNFSKAVNSGFNLSMISLS